MTHLLLAMAMTMNTHEARPPARWIPPPKPVMTLAEVVVYGDRSRRLIDCCNCLQPSPYVIGYMSFPFNEEGRHQGDDLLSWTTGRK